MGKESKIRQKKEMVRSVHSKEAAAGDYGDEMQVVQAAYMDRPPLISLDWGFTSQVTRQRRALPHSNFHSRSRPRLPLNPP